MSTKRVRPRASPIKLKLPEWIMGGDPKEVGRVCGWDIEPTQEPGTWHVVSKEGAHGRNGQLLRISKMADRTNGNSQDAYTRMHRLKRFDRIGGEAIWRTAREAQRSLVDRYPGESSTMLMSMQILISAAPSAREAAAIVRSTFTQELLLVADNPSVYLVEVSDTLAYRYTIARTLLATKGDVSGETFRAESLISKSSRGLFSDTTMGYDAYFSCMSASLSPAIWAYPIGRPGAVVLLLFGDAMAGQESLARDKIQHLSPRVRPSEETPPATSAPRTYVQAAQWWVEQLSTLFSIITEPANYSDGKFFDPAEATERLLTVEQMFRDCQSILTSTRDDHARTILTFTLLKRLQGVVPHYNWKTVVGRTSLENIVRKLQADIPSELHDIFVRRAERAVRAVMSLERGFFSDGDGLSTPILLPNKHGDMAGIDRKAAVTEWLQIVRDSLHGFDKPSARDRALLAAHDGTIPSEFADVAWLHILDLMAHPEKLAKFQRLQGKSQRHVQLTGK